MTSFYSTLPPGLRHRATTGDGLSLEVREWGDPSGPPVILIPGLAQSTLAFAPQYADPRLSGYRLVSYDPRGHGLSDKPLGTEWYSGSRWSLDIDAVTGALGIEKPVLAGWSLGGRILRQYLVDRGDAALSGVAFISCRPVEVPSVVGLGNKVVADLDIDDLASRIRVSRAFLRNCFLEEPPQADFEVMIAYNILCPFEIRRQIGQWLTPEEVSRKALAAVTKPALIVHGARDVLVLPEAARITASLVPHARLKIYEGIGHSVFYEIADLFNADFAAFAAEAFGAASGKDSA